MDATEQMVLSGEVSAAVLGKGENFVLVDLDGPLDDSVGRDVQDRGFVYCGVLGLRDGQLSVKYEPGPDAAITMVHAGLRFAEQVSEKLQQSRASVEWLERLYQLPDPRPEGFPNA